MPSIVDVDGDVAGRIRLTLVVAMYCVEAYLSEFLDSLAAQDVTGFDVEYIFVDDGSPQDEARLVGEWLAATRLQGRVLRKENGGVSSARNLGIEHATGDWVSFPDPDDILAPGYLRGIAEYIATSRGTAADVVAARLVFYYEESGEKRDSHPLGFKFESAPKSLSLLRLPHVLQLHTNSAFVRRSTLLESGVRFDERLSVGEDAVFLGYIFGTSASPVLGVVPSALYYYRKRAARDSALDTSSREPQRLIDRLRFGYLPMIRSLATAGRLHEWAAHLALYDLGWLYRQELPMTPLSASLGADQRAQVLDATREMLSLFQEDWIFTSLRPTVPDIVRTLWATLRAEALGTELRNPIGAVKVAGLDSDRELLQLRFLFTGAEPEERVLIGGMETGPVASKTRVIDFFGQRTMFERILWVPATSSLRVYLDGQAQLLTYAEAAPVYSLLRAQIWKHFRRSFRSGSELRAIGGVKTRRPGRGRSDRLRKPNARVLRDAGRLLRRGKSVWIFMDRLDMAQDNAEHLYRHVRKTHPNIEAWFVLERGSSDWSRLRAEGFNLAAFRSDKHLALLLVADHLISSHVDLEMTDPVPASFYPDGRRPWRFTFLQHGVIKDDLSGWLNRKPISTFVTTTEAEYSSIVGDRTRYIFTTKEVVMTGLPRHDALLRKVEASRRAGHKRLVVIAPTWRDGLLAPKRPFQPRELVTNFGESAYAINWRSLLNSTELRSLVEGAGRELVFLPHPWMQQFAQEFGVPPEVRTVRYSDGDIQEILASTDALITDYSSLAFEVAYAGAPSVYFHFDAKSIFSGGHTYTAGYFDYERDGFGPVAETLAGVIDGLSGLLGGQHADAPYRLRIEQTFPRRDGLSSDRVVAAILKSRPSVGAATRVSRRPVSVRALSALRHPAKAVRVLVRRWNA